jgi:non-canonical poly(A) RNA polymerase PAPD5/7
MTLAGAHGILTSTAFSKAGILNSRRDSRSHRLRDRYEAEDVSILSSVMGVTQEVRLEGQPSDLSHVWLRADNKP